MCGLAEADHLEYGREAAVPLIVAAACAAPQAGLPRLSGRMKVAIEAGSLASRLYGENRAEEEFTCSYELNPDYEPVLERQGLRITGRGEGGEPRIVELPHNRFFIATLFLPQLSSTAEVPHPIVLAFVKAAMTFASNRREKS